VPLFFAFFCLKTCTYVQKVVHLIHQTNRKKMITSRRTLAIELSKGNVNAATVSKKLDRIVNLWLSRNEIVKEAGQYKLA